MEIQTRRSNVNAPSNNHFLKVAVSMQFLVSLWRGGERPDILVRQGSSPALVRATEAVLHVLLTDSLLDQTLLRLP